MKPRAALWPQERAILTAWPLSASKRSRWIPQGLTHWPDRDAPIIIYYDGDKKLNRRLAVIVVASDSRGPLTA